MAVRGGGVEGVLPLFEIRGLLGGRGLVSVPYAVYGGICAPPRRPRGPGARRRDRSGGIGSGAEYVELRHRPGQQLENLPTKALYVTFARPIRRARRRT